MSLYKELKRNNKNLARRDHIIATRHKTGLLGGDSPEKADKVARAYAKTSEKQRRKKEGFDAVIGKRCSSKYFLYVTNGVMTFACLRSPNQPRRRVY